MKIVLFGATGMVGQAALRECLLDSGVERVLAIGRGRTGHEHDKLREIVRKDLTDYSGLDAELAGYDACFFCLGVSAAGMSEPDYRRVTHDIAVAAARALVRTSPGMTFVFVSGAGTDAKSKTMWARVKGETENELLSLGFSRAFMFRPALIQPMHGIVSHTKAYRIFYAVFGWMLPLFRVLTPRYVTTSERVGRAMLVVAKKGAPSPIVENRDINALAREYTP